MHLLGAPEGFVDSLGLDQVGTVLGYIFTFQWVGLDKTFDGLGRTGPIQMNPRSSLVVFSRSDSNRVVYAHKHTQLKRFRACK